MPVMGPIYKKDKTDKIYDEVLQVLSKNKILTFEPFYLKEKTQKTRETLYNNLYLALEELVKQDLYESF